MKKNKKVMVGIIVVLVLMGVISLSYAFLSVGDKQSLANTFNSGCLNITIENESNAISLNNAYPITDLEGLLTNGYTFTIKNTCSSQADFIVNLENINEQANTLSSDYLKVSINGDTFDNIVSILSSNTVSVPSVANAYEAYTIYTGSIEGNATRTFKIREWLDYDATVEQAANKVITNKINVIAKTDLEFTNAPGVKFDNNAATTYGDVASMKYCSSFDNICTPIEVANLKDGFARLQLDESIEKQIICSNINGGDTLICSEPFVYENVLIAGSSGTTAPASSEPFFGGNVARSTFESVTTLNNINIPSDAIYSWDVSEAQNESIIAWYTDADGNGKYELYIGQKDGVKANSESSYLFCNFTNLKSVDLSNLDTSKATSIRFMFRGIANLPELDLSNFDTSKVKNMRGMFYSSGVESVDLSSFNTSNVESMQQMFYMANKIVNLDLRNFDTSKVKTMQNMFYGCRGMQELNVSSFNTQNVTNMSGMFGENINLNSLDVRNFNTSKVQNMSGMFVALYKVPELDLSNFDTSNVTNMQRMFYDNNTFTSLDISSFDTSNVTNMEEMFANMRKLNTLNMQNMVFDAVTSFDSMLDNVLVLNKIIVKDAAAKEFVEARMTDAGKSADITIYE